MSLQKISVIIIAHDRRKFILDAVESVLNQTLSKQMFEVIVVKNYLDKAIDSFLKKKGITTILTNEVSIGKKLSIGIRNSNGEVLSFLEDDDLFYAEKLETIYSEFSRNKNLSYFHNAYSTINPNGDILEKSYYDNPVKSIPILGKTENRKNVSHALKHAGFHNVSCISMRRDYLEMHIEILEKIKRIADSFMFLTALDSEGDIIVDKTVLTHFRIHTSMSHNMGDKDNFIKWNHGVNETILEDINSTKGHLTNLMAKKLLRFLEGEFAILSYISFPEKKMHGKCREILTYLWLSFFFQRSYPYSIVGAALLSVIFPATVQKLYFKRYRNFMNEFMQP